MQINKEQLQKALEKVKPGLAGKELIEQSTSFAFVGGRVITYNDEISISHPIEGLQLEGAILADNLYKFLGKVKKDEIELEINGNEILLTSGSAKAGLILQTEIKLPVNEEIAEKGKWKKLPEGFLEGMKFVMTACTRDMSKPILTCVHVNQEGYMEGSDSYRIARYDLATEMPVDTFLIPASSVVDMVKLHPIKIAEGKGWIHFQTKEQTIISCRLYDKDTYPVTDTFYSVEGQLVVLPQSLDKVLERAMVFAKRDHILDESILLTIKEKRLTIRADSETGWFEEEVPIQYKDSPISFQVTPYLLKSILSSSQGCTISKDKIKFSNEFWQYVAVLRYIKEKK
jgi:hypothetical protein